MSAKSPEEIDALLPQTQCGLCGYGGCMPYAEAIYFDHAPLHLCPPGGVATLRSLGELLEQDITMHIDEMQLKTKNQTLAYIEEKDCIGCTKCIAVCPVDAILGAAKHMHTVIQSECTGCELCVPACPVDCIVMIPSEREENAGQKDQYRSRFKARENRLIIRAKKQKAKKASSAAQHKKTYIAQALMRVKAKKA